MPQYLIFGMKNRISKCKKHYQFGRQQLQKLNENNLAFFNLDILKAAIWAAKDVSKNQKMNYRTLL